jgi:peptide/nickel transport system permease protein
MIRLLINCWRTSGKFKVGTIVLVLLIVVALAAPLLWRPFIGDKNPGLGGSFRAWDPPSPQHPLGIDGHGRDLVADYLLGLRSSLQIGFLSGVMAMAVGVVVGFFTGYRGGWLDHILLTFTNMLLVIPSYPILVTLAMVTRSMNIVTMSLILALFSWPFAARTIRAQVIGMKGLGYVELAKVSGQGDLAIIFAEILPNLMPYLLISLAFSVVGAMVAEVGLEVIGLGPSKIVTLGLMINYANAWSVISRRRYEILLIPVGLLIVIFAAITLINRGMEEYLNPRLQRRTVR